MFGGGIGAGLAKVSLDMDVERLLRVPLRCRLGMLFKPDGKDIDSEKGSTFVDGLI